MESDSDSSNGILSSLVSDVARERYYGKRKTLEAATEVQVCHNYNSVQ